MSEEALQAARELVKSGARAITPSRLCQDESRWGAVNCAQLLIAGSANARQVLAEAIGEERADRLMHQITGAESPSVTGAEAIAVMLAAAGVRHVFAYAGTSELAMCDAVNQVPRILLINGRGDKESAFLAAGGSLLRPNRAAAILHGARGLTNAAGGLADARRNEAGCVYVVGLPSTGSSRFLPPHGEFALIETLSGFARWSWEAGPVPTAKSARAEAASEFLLRLREALTTVATVPHGPALFGVPQDVAETRWIPVRTFAGMAPASVPPGTANTRSAMEVLRAARRPLFLVDDYALRDVAIHGVLDALSRRVGAPVLQLRYRRGPMLFERLQERRVRNFVGWLNQFSSVHRSLLEDCDLLITVEDRNIYRRVVGDLPKCRKIAVNSDPAKVVKNEYLESDDLLLTGSPAAVLRELASKLEMEERPGWYPQNAKAASLINPEPAADHVVADRGALSRTVADLLDGWDQPVLVDDSQMFGGLLSEHYDFLPVGLRVFGGHGGFVGGGLPYAIGMAVSDPSVQVLCLLGDQAFTNSFQALVLAVQENVNLVIVVCNNGQSVSLNKQATASYGPTNRQYLGNASKFRYHQVAQALGVSAWQVPVPIGGPREEVVAGITEFGSALRKAATTPGTALVELILPADPEAWRGIWLAQGFEQSAAVAVQ